VFVAVLLVTLGGRDDGAPSRYLSVALLPLAFLAGPGWVGTVEWLRAQRRPGSGALAWGLAAVAGVLPVLELVGFLRGRAPQLRVREGLTAAVTTEGIGEGVVVVRAQWPTRYARNGPFFDRPVLYLSPPATMAAADVAADFPGRPVYEAHEGDPWSLSRVR